MTSPATMIIGPVVPVPPHDYYALKLEMFMQSSDFKFKTSSLDAMTARSLGSLKVFVLTTIKNQFK